MNDSPGRTPPGPSPSDEQGNGVPAQSAPADDQAVRTEEPAPRAEEAAPASQWAREQPPRGQWSTPSAGPPPAPRRPTRARAESNAGPTGPYGPGQGAWGGNHWAPTPPAPQPGVIPLRPLGVGEILEGSFGTLRRHWRTALGISLAVAVATQAVTTVVTGVWFRDNPGFEYLDNPASATPGETLDAIGESLPGTGVTALVSLLGSIIATALLTVVVSRAVLGRSTSVADAWRSARPQLLRLSGLLFLLPALIVGVFGVAVAPGLLISAAGAKAVGVGVALFGSLAGMAGAAWLWIQFSLAAPALMLERQGVLASLRRSAKLVRGSWWRIFGVQLLAVFLVFVVATVIGIPVGIIEMIFTGESATSGTIGWSTLIISGVAAVISTTLMAPITAGVTALLYLDQRIRRESLDVELAQAASK
ncbi:hypothetical protein ACFWAT_25595 [Streptomyces syringium]|uniref:hypothetical protein n=1 Tax=Streptomyces syringium TaxID=76729 RepID=UPI0036630486